VGIDEPSFVSADASPLQPASAASTVSFVPVLYCARALLCPWPPASTQNVKQVAEGLLEWWRTDSDDIIVRRRLTSDRQQFTTASRGLRELFTITDKQITFS
jgi:hypothetical protein